MCTIDGMTSRVPPCIFNTLGKVSTAFLGLPLDYVYKTCTLPQKTH